MPRQKDISNIDSVFTKKNDTLFMDFLIDDFLIALKYYLSWLLNF